MLARILLLAAAVPAAYGADVCTPAVLGAYGFQLSGVATISRAAQPVVSVGRLVFDGQGGLSGVSSVSFTGLYLGNPVTGTYQARTDCSLDWSLQDDSGNHQHFHGTMKPDRTQIRFQQTDPGSPSHGLMIKSQDACQESDFQPRYRFAASGALFNVGTGQVSGSFSRRGMLQRDQGRITFEPASGAPGTATIEFEDDCFVRLHVKFSAGSPDAVDMNFRAILVSGGKELLGMAVDPGTAVTLHLTAP